MNGRATCAAKYMAKSLGDFQSMHVDRLCIFGSSKKEVGDNVEFRLIDRFAVVRLCETICSKAKICELWGYNSIQERHRQADVKCEALKRKVHAVKFVITGSNVYEWQFFQWFGSDKLRKGRVRRHLPFMQF